MLSGLVKLCGHPVIDSSSGMKKVYERTHKDIAFSDASVSSVRNMIINDHCQNYFRLHKKWPLRSLRPGAQRP